MKDLGSTLKTIAILAAAVVVAFLLWKVISFAVSIFVTLVTVLIFAAILYVAFIIVRSTVKKRDSTPRI
jgi:hypothetical protein